MALEKLQVLIWLHNWLLRMKSQSMVDQLRILPIYFLLAVL
uniref:Uncharacterized protein n=1 Tax=Zea mays TaxID=4577 RepID=B4FBW2_MAIZE|nr:unknown [Zea mays]